MTTTEHEDSVHVGEAGVKTVSVTIKAVQIGRKQMTQSVFRQLKNEPILDINNGSRRGEMWGTVNYHWQGCGLIGDHLHIVWQKGSDLRRTCVNEQYESEGLHSSNLELREALAVLGEIAIVRAVLKGRKPSNTSHDGIEIDGWKRSFSENRYVRDAISDLLNERSPDKARVEAKATLEESLKNYAIRIEADSARTVTRDEALQAETQEDFVGLGKRIKGKVELLATAWEKFQADITALDQLFIAV